MRALFMLHQPVPCAVLMRLTVARLQIRRCRVLRLGYSSPRTLVNTSPLSSTATIVAAPRHVLEAARFRPFAASTISHLTHPTITSFTRRISLVLLAAVAFGVRVMAALHGRRSRLR